MSVETAKTWQEVPAVPVVQLAPMPGLHVVGPIHDPADLLQKLDACRLRTLENPPPRPPAILGYNCKIVGEAGNVLVVQGQAKAGKTAVSSAILGAAIGGEGDCLGLKSPNPHNKAVLHFDTEQSSHHHYDAVERTVKARAKKADIPEHLRSYTILKLDTPSRRGAIRAEMERAAQEHGGIHLVVIDGVADIASDPNDATECIALVDELHQLAEKYQCLVVVVLHENPGSEMKKTRGHLGSQLERKAQTSVVVVKGEDEVVAMYARMARSCKWDKKEAGYFKYDPEYGMHVTVDDPTVERQEEKDAAERKMLKTLAEKVLTKPMLNKDLVKAIMEDLDVSESTAKSRITRLLYFTLIEKSAADKMYRPVPDGLRGVRVNEGQN